MSTANVVVHLRARPVLVDVGQDFNIQVCTSRAGDLPGSLICYVYHHKPEEHL